MVRAIAGTAGCAVLVACASAGEQDALPVIDAHVHTAFTGEREPASGVERSRAALRSAMKEAGVVRVISHTDSTGAGYDSTLAASDAIFCAGVGGHVNAPRIDAGLRDGRYRCIKVYLGYAYRYATDSVYRPVYDLARRYDVPVVFHTGDTWSARGKLAYAHPLVIDEVAVDHPDVTFVIAHAGYPWYRTAAAIAYKNPNVYLEASAFMVGHPDSVDAAWLDEYVVRPIRWIFGYVEDPSKLLFGSDWPLVDMAGYVAAYKRAIPREHWHAVFHDNAERVFRLARE